MGLGTAKWATTNGDVWAERWRETDRGLSGLAPALHSAILAAAPGRPFAAFDVGCGPGSTSMDLAQARPDAQIVACDLSPSLAQLARQRLEHFRSVEVVLGDATAVATERGPFDLIYSRHGVMFFPDPVAAFRELRSAASDAARIVFSCFRSWSSNPWASEIAAAAAGRALEQPGREPSGFAFAEPDYVRGILEAAGWRAEEPEAVAFRYVAGEGTDAVAEALSFLCAIGPAARVMEEMPPEARDEAAARMKSVIEAHGDGRAVEFEAAAWIWTAEAADVRRA